MCSPQILLSSNAPHASPILSLTLYLCVCFFFSMLLWFAQFQIHTVSNVYVCVLCIYHIINKNPNSNSIFHHFGIGSTSFSFIFHLSFSNGLHFFYAVSMSKIGVLMICLIYCFFSLFSSSVFSFFFVSFCFSCMQKRVCRSFGSIKNLTLHAQNEKKKKIETNVRLVPFFLSFKNY